MMFRIFYRKSDCPTFKFVHHTTFETVEEAREECTRLNAQEASRFIEGYASRVFWVQS